jgi:hypothetical protein
MSTVPSHTPFHSIYRPNFEVVAERQGKTTLFPHTAQLPVLLRALHLEFFGALPPKVARVDKRADGYHKYLLKSVSDMFCLAFNADRKDGLHLLSLPDANRICRPVLVQQITEQTPLGRTHRFRFYGKDGFLPDVYLSGKRMVFADHVLERFSTRVPNPAGHDLSYFLCSIFGSFYISMPVGAARACVLSYFDSLLAFTYTETDEEFFFTTCLTVNEINSLTPELPPQPLNLHYGQAFTRPTIRNWIVIGQMKMLYELWKAKKPFTVPNQTLPPGLSWKKLASFVRDVAAKEGYGPGTELHFLDDIPCPFLFACRPGEPAGAFDELSAYKKTDPNVDWDAVFAESAALTSETPEEHLRRTGRR